MNIHQSVPDRSPEAIAKRRRATDEARAAVARQGYKHDPVLEAATEAYVNGDITRDQYRSRVVRPPQQA
ncbi:antitoxin VbhA family protein [Agrobacterium tumefaciens]|uniref:antitoxin VbhA family protein n=1 Tax=Agrobacterium tumefaciens TaxID=358 RepID=UPI0015748297|nr:antitoxin VbhA family protein [Agrobacterium tumefaciens]